MKIIQIDEGSNLKDGYIFRCYTDNFLEILSMYEWCKSGNILYGWTRDDSVWKNDDSDDFYIEIKFLTESDAIFFKLSW